MYAVGSRSVMMLGSIKIVPANGGDIGTGSGTGNRSSPHPAELRNTASTDEKVMRIVNRS
jgi:hypothetical protein